MKNGDPIDPKSRLISNELLIHPEILTRNWEWKDPECDQCDFMLTATQWQSSRYIMWK